MTITPIKRSAVALLANDIAEQLRADGPLPQATLRQRLGVASAERFLAAVHLLKGDGTIDVLQLESEGTASGMVLRIKGDERPLPRLRRAPLSRALRELANRITSGTRVTA